MVSILGQHLSPRFYFCLCVILFSISLKTSHSAKIMHAKMDDHLENSEFSDWQNKSIKVTEIGVYGMWKTEGKNDTCLFQLAY